MSACPRWLLSVFAVAILAIIAGRGPELMAEGEKAAPVLPTEQEFHALVKKLVAGYPTDGTHQYYWPREGSWAGTTRDLRYGDGSLVAEGDPQGRCYCCGLTFEVFFRAFELHSKKLGVPTRIGDLDAKGVERLRREWFGTQGDRRTSQDAISKNGLGRALEDPTAARPGDFVQFWRHSGSGHSVIFLGFEGKRGERPGALVYWSTQKATNGIGVRTEPIGPPDGIIWEEIYAARAGRRPEAKAGDDEDR